MAGLIHVYCGDGKGKTTAAAGLAARAAGAGKQVVFTQFFKNGSSGEIKSLKCLDSVRTMHCKTVPGRFSRMNEEEKAQARADYQKLLEDVMEASKDADLLVLDEAVSACNHGMIQEERLIWLLRHKPEKLEVVLTGRNPSEKLLEMADYITEMRKVRHPYDRGIKARKGIEF